MTGLASYSYGIYMVHPIIAQVLRALIPDIMHLLQVASLNTVSILLFHYWQCSSSHASSHYESGCCSL